MKKNNLRLLGIAIITLLWCSCAKENIEDMTGELVPIDTTIIYTYASVDSILDVYACKNCHSGVQPTAGIDLTTYSNVRGLTENGSLLGTVKGEPGYSIMPPNGATLTTNDIAIIENWQDNDYPN
jgi:hypothetical protein